ncbi:MAG: MMPL family transporter [Candidatus Omnitrophica bacterium]|nr:MMPL family transporter [Candidatus Omnitrophota bacterium]
MMFAKIVRWCFRRPKPVFAVVTIAVVLGVSQFSRIQVDTDPENMLPRDEPVRLRHDQVKEEFGIYDFIVVGVVREGSPQGVFQAETLNRVYRITERIKKIDGVISREIIAPSTKDNIRQGGPGTVVFEWLMAGPIETAVQAERIRDEALDNPMFRGTMVSGDGKALAIYVPIQRKDMSYRISREIQAIIDEFSGEEEYYITGLPVAEDTFGVEMFKQMAVSAPLAGAIIFLLMLLFFKSVRLIISPMLLAVATVLITMGLLIGFGLPVHIMSSMIPIFLMPIAVLDSVHILSEFFDQYRIRHNKRDALLATIEELFSPMLFTSLTSAVGFFSLSFSPIPPVQTFGIFVAIGVMLAWALTMTFIPAYIGALSDNALRKMKKGSSKEDRSGPHGAIDVVLKGVRTFSLQRAKLILSFVVAVILVSIYGISQIRVNDNPIRWFTENHRIRIADRVLNEHFAGTYTAYLVLEAENGKDVFKRPDMLNYIQQLQRYLEKQGQVGKSTSLTDVVKKVYMELMGGEEEYFTVPETKQAVSQCLISYENSHKPDDLWHMATPDYDKVNLWIQLNSGDNKDMSQVVAQASNFMRTHKPPYKFESYWAGLTYINMVWQDKMVVGMLKNFLGSFIIVFFMMTFLFRSPYRGLISMVPLTVTILCIYGLLGIVGKDYDMPVAVLSALTLGLSIDFAIHFIQRAREIHAAHPGWERASRFLFQGPGRAIVRNALVIAVGFLPLLVAPLIPYRTVGFFMFAIMLVSSIATLIILPAIITLIPDAVFAGEKKKFVCNCGYCVVMAIAAAAAVGYVLRGYTFAGWDITVFAAIGVIAVMAGICAAAARRKFCITKKEDQ